MGVGVGVWKQENQDLVWCGFLKVEYFAAGPFTVLDDPAREVDRVQRTVDGVVHNLQLCVCVFVGGMAVSDTDVICFNGLPIQSRPGAVKERKHFI